ncbi:hypothetical protein I350_08342 [Cryptococcus amylolentus CBS 6273]|uniref:HORMA domain-containing protein n=1 Tax=Cryptococcus amylolentus CBS 6273 TaxID=1296118 RepID=A0A1E3J632_9TREE|nr:hypothetical protein I350_08342 [Cryptococcus amylolentus CBS 6273]
MPAKQAFRPPKPIQKSAKTTTAATTSTTTKTTAAAKSKATQPRNAQKQTTTLAPQELAQTQAQAQVQAQSLRVEQSIGQDQSVVTQTESLAIMRVSLEASLGAICYLRRLLHDDNFVDTYMASSTAVPDKTPEQQYGLSQPDPNSQMGSQPHGSQQSQSKGFKYPKISDSSPEGRRLLNLIDDGVMDAVSKGYLRSFMFILFLDKDDPSNIIESYTFNFFYTGASNAPSLSMTHATGSPSGYVNGDVEVETVGAVKTSAELEAPKTHQDCRKAVKAMMKTLILKCQKLPDLPRQRYVDFKLSYNESAPPDYEAPGFKDCSGTSLLMATCDVDAAPSNIQMGNTATGTHGISVTAQSIVEYLPSRLDSDERQGVSDPGDVEKEYEEQMTNVKKRKVAWCADLPVYDRQIYEPDSMDPYSVLKQPLGKLREDGTVEPMFKPGMRPDSPSAAGKKRARDMFDEDLLELSGAQREPTVVPRSASVVQTVYDHDADGETEFEGSQLADVANGAQASRASIRKATRTPTEQPRNVSVFRDTDTPPDSGAPVPDPAPDRQPLQDKDPNERPRKSPKTTGKSTATGTDDSSITRQSSSKSKKKQSSKKSHKKAPVFEESPTDTGNPVATTPASRPTSPRKTAAQKMALAAASPDKQRPTTKKSAAPRVDTHVVEVEGRDPVTCFCGSVDEDDASIQCDGCGHWVHLPCVGFSVLKAAAQTQDWFCILCQMDKDNKHTWTKNDYKQVREGMARLAIVRRLLSRIRGEGGIGNEVSQYTESLNCTKKTLKRALATIHKDGFIDGVHGSRRGKKAYYRYLQNTDTSKRLVEYFDPGAGVEIDLFPFRKAQHSDDQTDEPPEPLPNSQGVPMPDLPSTSSSNNPSGMLDLNSSRTSSSTVRTTFGNSIPCLDKYPVNQWMLPAIRSSRAEEPIELLENW